MIAFKSVVTAIIIITAIVLFMSLRLIQEQSGKNFMAYIVGIYLLSLVAIWI